jgi:hypothetical protein
LSFFDSVLQEKRRAITPREIKIFVMGFVYVKLVGEDN